MIAGELLRLLVHHPEVELNTAYSPGLSGVLLSRYHKGIVGNTDLKFTAEIDLNDLDILFITTDSPVLDKNTIIPEGLKIIQIAEDEGFTLKEPFADLDYVTGLSEMFRKPLVRGARNARVLPSPIGVALIILYPLALNLLLNDSVCVKIELPGFKMKSVSADYISHSLSEILRESQFSFNSIKEVEIMQSQTFRTLTVEVEFKCGINVEEIERIYSSVYDDHNFTHIVQWEPAVEEVAATQKCLLYVSKPTPETVKIKALADSVMRGGAGDAIHSMNLLFGLFEKIGLDFPAAFAYKADVSIS